MTNLIWTKFTKDVVIGGREFQRGTISELTLAEFQAAVSARAGVPTGERGKCRTMDSTAREMKIGGTR